MFIKFYQFKKDSPGYLFFCLEATMCKAISVLMKITIENHNEKHSN